MAARKTTTRLASYEILRSLAHGGMAELFLARATGPQGFEKLVVLKKILPQLARDPAHVRQFLDEARLAACLDHPNVVHVYDIGMVEQDYCFTMEYVHGRDLRAVLERGKLTVQLVLQIACDVAAALHHAHERRGHDGQPLGIVHRDVSPANILVSYDGIVKLGDFGIAKAATSSIHTRVGVVKGRPGYLSPEQARGERVDRRSDVFALGAVLWEMLTGQAAFVLAAGGKQLFEQPPPPPSTLRAECPRDLDAIVGRALALEPERRHATAQQLLVELEELARVHRLGRSSVALAEHMQARFRDEIAAWKLPEPGDVTRPDVPVVAVIEPAPDDEPEEPTRSLDDEPTRVAPGARDDTTRPRPRRARSGASEIATVVYRPRPGLGRLKLALVLLALGLVVTVAVAALVRSLLAPSNHPAAYDPRTRTP